MPHTLVNDKENTVHTDDIQDIISSPPSWLLRWGIALVFFILASLICLSSLIAFPDIVKAKFKITSLNTSKTIVAKTPGRIMSLLVSDQQQVESGQPLAFIESTASHKDVLQLLKKLLAIQQVILNGNGVVDVSYFSGHHYELGELQAEFQNFNQEFVTYQEAVNSGLWVQKKKYLKFDLDNLVKQKFQLDKQKQLLQRDIGLAAEEYEMNKKLVKENAETVSEFREAESRYLSKQAPLVQTESALIKLEESYSSKQKEIIELDNQMHEQRMKFLQSLNTLISQSNEWKNRFILSASQAGKLSFIGIIQPNSVLQVGQEVFYVNSGSKDYFGQMAIPQFNLGKVKTNQLVLLKLASYPFEEYGMITGKISNINDVPYKDSVFLSTVKFRPNKSKVTGKSISLKEGMIGDAEIITEEATVLQRIVRNFTKLVRSR